MSLIPEGDGWWSAAGLLLGGGGVGALAIKMFDKIVNRLMERAENREVRKEDAEIRFREELRQEIMRVQAQWEAAERREDEVRRTYNKLFRANTEMETENRLLRAAILRMRAYLVYQQQQLNKTLGLPESPAAGIPAWIDDTIPGPTAETPNIPMSPTRDPGKRAMGNGD